MVDARVWLLMNDSNKDMTLQPDIVNYFWKHPFDGKPMKDTWQAPTIEVRRKSLRLRDFVSWQASAPVLSQRAIDVLGPLIEPHAEILPLIVLKKRQYYAINVLTLVDCLDYERSDIAYYAERPQTVRTVNAACFRADRMEDVPLFKLPEDRSGVFVRWPFIEAVKAADLQGAYFVDPANTWNYVFYKYPDCIDPLQPPGTPWPRPTPSPTPPTVFTIRDRPLEEDERQEVTLFSRNGLTRLGLSGTEAPGDIVSAIGAFLERFRKQVKKPTEDQITVISLEMGTLWAEQVCREKGWIWVAVPAAGQDYYAVVPPDRSRANYPIVWFGELLRHPRRQSNQVLAFNLLVANRLPPAAPGQYAVVQ